MQWEKNKSSKQPKQSILNISSWSCTFNFHFNFTWMTIEMKIWTGEFSKKQNCCLKWVSKKQNCCLKWAFKCRRGLNRAKTFLTKPYMFLAALTVVICDQIKAKTVSLLVNNIQFRGKILCLCSVLNPVVQSVVKHYLLSNPQSM
jgi:hypothetical protein